jgi:uncharacterized lipoprotein YehR (DUF1307 family)
VIYLKGKTKMVNENLVKKITKLLAMATRGTGNEADIALKKAQTIMEEHGLTQKDIELFTIDIPDTKRKQRWVCILSELVATFSGVVSISAYKMFIFAGDEIGVNVARELFYYLKNEIIRKTSENKITGRKKGYDFKIGLVRGLYKRMEAVGGWRDMKQKRNEIIKGHFSQLKKKPITSRCVDGDIYELGKGMAQEINLNRQTGYSGASGFLPGGNNG